MKPLGIGIRVSGGSIGFDASRPSQVEDAVWEAVEADAWKERLHDQARDAEASELRKYARHMREMQMSAWTKPELENMLEDVVNELDLSDGMIEHHGPLGTAPAKLVRQVMARKDRQIAMLSSGFRDVGDAEARLETNLTDNVVELSQDVLSTVFGNTHGMTPELQLEALKSACMELIAELGWVECESCQGTAYVEYEDPNGTTRMPCPTCNGVRFTRELTAATKETDPA
jgi:hypothetical protein